MEFITVVQNGDEDGQAQAEREFREYYKPIQRKAYRKVTGGNIRMLSEAENLEIERIIEEEIVVYLTAYRAAA